MGRDDDVERFYSLNREWWDGVTPHHEASVDYDRAGFLRGEKPLCPVELAELGPLVSGKTLLHLQCHFGLDTLNWARLGAQVTGLDFSGAAIEAANRLVRESGVPGRFLQANVYDAPSVLADRFDIVYTGIGALCWLPDISRWAHVVAECLRPRGSLYVYEGHPVLWALDEEREDDALVVRSPYFEQREPEFFESDRTYVDTPTLPTRRGCNWNHGLGEIVTALLRAGLQLEFLHEHREVAWRALPSMEPVDVGFAGSGGAYQSGRMWQLPPSQRAHVPLMYSLLARKPG